MISLGSTGTASTPGAHVLLVDDAADNRELYALALKYDGYRVTEAAFGAEALDRLEHGPPPDILVTDIVLPDFDGFELCRRMKAHPALRDTPVIAITALPLTEREVGRARQAGSVLLHKPCLPETLLGEIRLLLKQVVDLRERASQARERSRELTKRSRVLQERSLVLQADAMRVVDRMTQDALLKRIRAEYREMPGLSVTLDQARRLWAMEPHVCQGVLDELILEGFLMRGREGKYVRAGDR